jgi:hypothetical protein
MGVERFDFMIWHWNDSEWTTIKCCNICQCGSKIHEKNIIDSENLHWHSQPDLTLLAVGFFLDQILSWVLKL